MGIGSSISLQKAFGNSFAQRMYKHLQPQYRNIDYLMKKLPYSKIYRQFLKPALDNFSLQILIDSFLENKGWMGVYNDGLIASGFTESNEFFIMHMLQLYSNCADQLDPSVLQQIYSISTQINSIKQRNIASFKTQLITSTLYEQDFSKLTGKHAEDYMANYKKFMIEALSQFLFEKLDCQKETQKPKVEVND